MIDKSTLSVDEILANYTELIDEELHEIQTKKMLLDMKEKNLISLKERGWKPKPITKAISDEEWDKLPIEAKFYDYVKKLDDRIKGRRTDDYEYDFSKLSNDFGYTRIRSSIIIKSKEHPAYSELKEKGKNIFGSYFKDLEIHEPKKQNSRFVLMISFIEIMKYDEIIWKDWNGKDNYEDAMYKIIDYIESFNK